MNVDIHAKVAETVKKDGENPELKKRSPGCMNAEIMCCCILAVTIPEVYKLLHDGNISSLDFTNCYYGIYATTASTDCSVQLQQP